MRQAPEFAERDDVGQERDDEEERFAMHGQEDCPTKNGADQQINQNREEKLRV